MRSDPSLRISARSHAFPAKDISFIVFICSILRLSPRTLAETGPALHYDTMYTSFQPNTTTVIPRQRSDRAKPLIRSITTNCSRHFHSDLLHDCISPCPTIISNIYHFPMASINQARLLARSPTPKPHRLHVPRIGHQYNITHNNSRAESVKGESLLGVRSTRLPITPPPPKDFFSTSSCCCCSC